MDLRIASIGWRGGKKDTKIVHVQDGLLKPLLLLINMVERSI
jgi:hypothetical protein